MSLGSKHFIFKGISVATDRTAASALAGYEKQSPVRAGSAPLPSICLEVSDGMTFSDLFHFSQAGEECSSSQVVWLSCYLSDSSSEGAVSLRSKNDDSIRITHSRSRQISSLEFALTRAEQRRWSL